jgi:ferredoxin
MRVRVDPDVCVGHARCNAVAPEVFALDDVGYALPIDREVDAAEVDQVRAGERACPEGAIIVTDD